MEGVIRDSSLGGIIRFLSGRRLLIYPEDLSTFEFRPEEYFASNAVEKSELQHDLEANPPSPERDQGLCESEASNDDKSIEVSWYGPDDPENPLNWSSRKKAWVTFLIA